MQGFSGLRAALASVACLASLSAACAADARSTGRYEPPSADAVELAALAPPSRYSPAAQTYGDAPYARALMRRHGAGRAENVVVPHAPLGIVPCEPRVARAGGYVCGVTPHAGYGEFYAFTPAYVTSPLVPRLVPSVPHTLLPPATSFFYSANNFLFGSNN